MVRNQRSALSRAIDHPLNALIFTGAVPGADALSALSEGLWELNLTPTGASPLRIAWRLPALQIVGMWHSWMYRDRSLRADWAAGMHSHATVNAPVVCLFGAGGENRLTFACSEALQPVELRAGIVEETGELLCEVRVATATADQSVRIRIDRRAVAWQRALGDVTDWWAAMPLHQPAPVPDVARGRCCRMKRPICQSAFAPAACPRPVCSASPSPDRTCRRKR